MERALQIAFAIQFALFGLSHLLRPQPLIQFFIQLRSMGQAGIVFIALPTVITGSLLVAFHNVWSGIPILLTVYGWAQLFKGTLYLFFPSYGLRQLARVTPETTNWFRLPGIPFLVVAALLAWHLVYTA